MLLSKFLTRTFKGMPYNKYEPISKESVDSFCIYDMAENGKAVAFNDTLFNRPSYEYITDFIDESEIRELVEYCKTFPDRPMLISTHKGLALAFPWLFPSASYIIISFLNVGTDKYYREMLFNKEKLSVSSSVAALRMRGRPQKDDVRAVYRRYSHELDECFGALVSQPVLRGSAVHSLENYIYAISHYVGCGAEVECFDDVKCAGEIDAALLASFLLVFMLRAKVQSPKKEATFEIRKQSNGIVISAMFEARPKPIGIPNGLDMFEKLCRRKNLRFEYTSGDGIEHVYFEPMRIDW